MAFNLFCTNRSLFLYEKKNKITVVQSTNGGGGGRGKTEHHQLLKLHSLGMSIPVWKKLLQKLSFHECLFTIIVFLKNKISCFLSISNKKQKNPTHFNTSPYFITRNSSRYNHLDTCTNQLTKKNLFGKMIFNVWLFCSFSC